MMRNYFVDPALSIDIREDKLPAWAREKLTTMRRATTEARTELAEFMAGSEPGPFWYAPWEADGKRFYLPTLSGRLMYGDPNEPDEQFTISAGSKQMGDAALLTIVSQGHLSLAVIPVSSNVIQLKGIKL